VLLVSKLPWRLKVNEYLSIFKILSDAQFGFRNGISTEDAVTSLTSTIGDCLDKGTKCVSCNIDLKKAFDTVSIPILVHKLKKIGIRDKQLAIFEDYLSGRSQRVKLDDVMSESVNVNYGVPQGSALGPTLFLIYINDLCNLKLDNAKIFSYADDTAIVFTGSDWDKVSENAERGMARIAKWLKNNLLTLNTTKTNYICHSIYSNSQPTLDFDIKIHSCGKIPNSECDCTSIKKVNQTKYLGVVVDEGLSWYPQIEYITARIRKFIWMFKSLRHIIPAKILNNIYISLVQSVIAYCIPVWGGALKTRFLEVERAQRMLLKVMYFKKRTFPTSELYLTCNLLSVRKLYILLLMLRKHKHQPYDPETAGRRRRHAIVCIPQINTNFASVQTNYRSAVLYNKINSYIYIHNKPFYECKQMLVSWLNTQTYDSLETFIN
jgi:hypothetical protein